MPQSIIADGWLLIVTGLSMTYAVINIDYLRTVWEQRNEQYISQRRPIMLVAYCGLASIYLFFLMPVINIHNIYSTDAFDAIYFFVEALYGTVFPTFINIIAIRVWLLYFEHKFAMATVDRIWRKAINPGEKNFFLRNKATAGNHYYLSRGVMIFWVFKITLLCTLMFSFMPHPFHSRTDELVFFTFRICIIVPTLIFILVIYNKVHMVHDEFNIRNEMRYLAYFVAFLIISGLCALGLLMFSDVPISYLDLFVYTNDVFFYIGTCYVQTRWVLKKYQQKKDRETTQRTNSRNAKLSITMVDVLREKHAFEAFVRHCVNELSVESLLFLVEVAQYKATLTSYDVPEPASQYQSLNVQKVNLRHILLAHWMEVNKTDRKNGGRETAGHPDRHRKQTQEATEEEKEEPEIPESVRPHESMDGHQLVRKHQYQLFQQSILGRKWLPMSLHIHTMLNDRDDSAKSVEIEEPEPASPSLDDQRKQAGGICVMIDGIEMNVWRPNNDRDDDLKEPTLSLDVDESVLSGGSSQRDTSDNAPTSPSHSTLSHDWIREYGSFLYDKYVKEESDLALNISYETREFLEQFYTMSDYDAYVYIVERSGGEEDTRSELPAGIDQDLLINTYLYHLFDAAFEEVWALLQSDSFIRFSMTAAYEKLKEPPKDEGLEVVFDALMTNDLVVIED